MIDIRNTCIRRNRARHKGAAMVNDGGCIFISTSTLHENACEGLGVMVNSQGEVRIINCDIRANTSKDNILHNTGCLEINNCLLRLNLSKRIIFNDEDGHFIIFDAKFFDNCVEESVVCHNGKKSIIEKTVFEDDLSLEELWNVVNAGEMTLDGIQINDSGVTILNKGVIFVKHPQDDLIDKIKSEGRLDML